jgi:hypothetical protein
MRPAASIAVTPRGVSTRCGGSDELVDGVDEAVDVGAGVSSSELVVGVWSDVVMDGS